MLGGHTPGRLDAPLLHGSTREWLTWDRTSAASAPTISANAASRASLPPASLCPYPVVPPKCCTGGTAGSRGRARRQKEGRLSPGLGFRVWGLGLRAQGVGQAQSCAAPGAPYNIEGEHDGKKRAGRSHGQGFRAYCTGRTESCAAQGAPEEIEGEQEEAWDSPEEPWATSFGRVWMGSPVSRRAHSGRRRGRVRTS